MGVAGMTPLRGRRMDTTRVIAEAARLATGLRGDISPISTGDKIVIDYDDFCLLTTDDVATFGTADEVLTVPAGAFDEFEGAVLAGEMDPEDEIASVWPTECLHDLRSSRARDAVTYQAACRLYVEAPTQAVQIMILSCPCDAACTEAWTQKGIELAQQRGLSIDEDDDDEIAQEAAEATRIELTLDAIYDVPVGGRTIPAIIAAAADEIVFVCVMLAGSQPTADQLVAERILVIRGDET